MFQHTIDRARSVVSEEHIVTIIARNHRKFLSESANGDLPGLVIEQPRGAWKRDFSRSG
jgi:mannose-1-phosphate guanylyltransferase